MLKKILRRILKRKYMITRKDYQLNRFNYLSKLVNLKDSEGLEIGACDLPTVPREAGKCEFADFRSAEEMSRLWNLQLETVMPVQYILKRDTKVHHQIDKKFDYVVLCHVIEHIPNMIGYIKDLHNLLKTGGVMLIVCPDKRRTPDASRPSTTIEHLLDDYYNDCYYPSLEHILEFGKTWFDELKQKSLRSAKEFYEWGSQNFESGLADAHCHVWTDEEFFTQIQYLIDGEILDGLKIIDKSYNDPLYNEFSIALKAVEPEQLEVSNVTDRVEVEQLQSQVQQAQIELQQAHATLAAMQTSKFWKLRIAWFKLKKALGLATL
jgi:SAM-dependent methyltransferase